MNECYPDAYEILEAIANELGYTLVKKEPIEKPISTEPSYEELVREKSRISMDNLVFQFDAVCYKIVALEKSKPIREHNVQIKLRDSLRLHEKALEKITNASGIIGLDRLLKELETVEAERATDYIRGGLVTIPSLDEEENKLYLEKDLLKSAIERKILDEAGVNVSRGRDYSWHITVKEGEKK